MEKPTLEEVGSEDLEAEPASPVAGRSKDAHDFLRTGGADAGVGIDVDAEVQWVKKLSQCLAVLERLAWHKSSKLHNTLKIIYVILSHLSF
jgi:hypothetical protein